MAIDPVARFERYTVKTDSCWLWTADPSATYPRMSVDGKRVSVHRWAYEHFVGPIPEGMFVDHLCRVKRCVNPAHLEPVTAQENTLRHYRADDICANGHRNGDADAYWHQGKRKCRECVREAGRRYYEAHKEERRAAAREQMRRRRHTAT